MANWKKAKEEVKSPINSTEVTSNKGENKEESVQVESPAIEDLTQKTGESQEQENQGEDKEQPKKLRIIADDRLNSLINTANEMGITDVVQIINSDRLSQFYLIYRE